MGILERRFRRKFERHGDGWLFRQWDRDVLFSDAEVEAFVAQWRLLWGTSLFWAGWVVLGIAAPLALGWSDMAYGVEAGILLAVTVNAAMGVMLVHGERIPNAAAEMSVDAGPGYGAGPKPSPVWFDLLFMFFAIVILWQGRRDGYDWMEWLWVLLFLLYAGSLLKRGIAWWRRRAAAA